MAAKPLFLLSLAIGLALPFLVPAAPDSAELSATLQPYFENHCLKCHGPEKEKGDVRLDTLPLPGAGTSADENETVLETWFTILDAIESGDMPPKKEPRPDSAENARVIELIADVIAGAAGPPAIALRRMNRTEYEYTVQDLLGIDTPLAELLPEDSSVQGFDNVADGLSISPVLMERYLEAADVAFESVIRRFPPLPAEARRAKLMEFKENIASVKGNKGGVIEVENSFVKFTPGWPPARIDDSHPIEGGIYRCRLAVWPHEPGDRTLSVAIYVGPLFGPGKQDFKGLYDVTGTPEKPRIIEFTTRMAEGETMHIVPWVYPEHVTWRDKHEARPGIAIEWAETYGPLDQSFPSEAQKQLFGDGESLSMVEGVPLWMRHRKDVKLHDVTSTQPREDAERIIRDLIPRAFRRPVDTALADQFVNLTLARLDEGRTFEQAVRAGVSAVLCSPHFLLLNRDPSVDDYTIASRLSYFLWSTLPDAELMTLAEQGKLRDPQVRHAQVERMIADPKIERFVQNFTGQWLDLREIEFTTPDKQLYPEFDVLLQESMLQETRGFFRRVLQENLSVMNFVDSDFTVLNERLANHYGIPGVKGHESFRVVSLPEDSIRGGLLTQGSILKVTANGTSTSPVLRGLWVMDRMLGLPAPPPPPGVPAVEPDIRGTTSIRDQLEQHSSNETCARCHSRIDPPGFALEEFDPIGGWRAAYRSLGEGEKVTDKKVSYKIGPPVQSADQLADGRAFANFAEFRQKLYDDPDLIARALAEKLLVYGTGRPITGADRAAVDAVIDAAKKQELGLRAMIHAVTDNELFFQP
ncbi:MAG: DUF1592 domain-containing protein [Verrucomicrobiae bacterium]|nr:DUF1592 domain-containing protein [Verrucomicrobiae bacterium]